LILEHKNKKKIQETKPYITRKTLSIVLNNGFSFGVHCVEEGDHIPPAAGLWPGIETEIS